MEKLIRRHISDLIDLKTHPVASTTSKMITDDAALHHGERRPVKYDDVTTATIVELPPGPFIGNSFDLPYRPKNPGMNPVWRCAEIRCELRRISVRMFFQFSGKYSPTSSERTHQVPGLV
ncbi:hypothetical protein QAD02_013105 [Eretmocerus hayati]|uniref:Uncharacterized protein n=1 Tax=Eretmocerus hayati TaxID=131215 RepID=A0ACC2P1H6_9HYME|nr:hypothetical protein QAD02_013105 [Eretmocerus hayati]